MAEERRHEAEGRFLSGLVWWDFASVMVSGGVRGGFVLSIGMQIIRGWRKRNVVFECCGNWSA